MPFLDKSICLASVHVLAIDAYAHLWLFEARMSRLHKALEGLDSPSVSIESFLSCQLLCADYSIDNYSEIVMTKCVQQEQSNSKI